MEHEIEALGAASVGDVLNGAHPVASGEPCRNCGTVVPERYCTNCGQLASNFHRPFWALAGEVLSDTFTLDGRLARTVPALLFFPGRMTRNYLAGQRARYVPPFRLFLLASIICFFSFFAASDNMGWFKDVKIGPGPEEEVVFAVGDDVELEFIAIYKDDAIQRGLAAPDIDAETREEWIERQAKREKYENEPRLFLPDGNVNRDAIDAFIESEEGGDLNGEQTEAAKRELYRMARVYENMEQSGQMIRTWLPRIAVLFAPIFALFLGLAYIWRRSFYTYDHLIVAMHYQTFLFIWSVILLGVSLFMPVMHDAVVIFLLIVPIVYLYRLLREAYQRGRFTTGLRVFVLFLVMPFIFVVLATVLGSLVYYAA